MPQPPIEIKKYLETPLPSLREQYPPGTGGTGPRAQWPEGTLKTVQVMDDFDAAAKKCEPLTIPTAALHSYSVWQRRMKLMRQISSLCLKSQLRPTQRKSTPSSCRPSRPSRRPFVPLQTCRNVYISPTSGRAMSKDVRYCADA